MPTRATVQPKVIRQSTTYVVAGATMGLIDSVKDALTPDEDDETVLYELECDDCSANYMTEEPPESATCEECGSSEMHEESRMYAGGGAGGGAG